MLQVVVPMALFTGIVAVLAAIVLTVKRRLVAREPVQITINGRETLDALSGDTLLAILHSSGIELPAACGGRGACGQCRVTLRNPGELLPTEANHINRRDAAAGVRLACVTKVTRSLDIQVPNEVLEAQRLVCRVISNRNVATFLKELVLELPDDADLAFQAGDYMLLEAPPSTLRFADFQIDDAYDAEWRTRQLDRLTTQIHQTTQRAYSIANPPGQGNRLTLVVRIALPPVGADARVPPGLVSSYVFSLKPGDDVTVAGPFGEFNVREPQNLEAEMVFIGGGAGIAPLRSIILDRLNLGHRGRLSFWYGSRNLRELCFADEFRAFEQAHDNFTYHIALSEPEPDDDWDGPTGFIHNVVADSYLNNHPHPEAANYFLCGPPLMSSATLAMLEDLGVDRENVLLDDFGTVQATEPNA
jgi:Na+-transporting NADH:ubiquinone oxidoreductase subunit F